jgi:hypothetical protein
VSRSVSVARSAAAAVVVAAAPVVVPIDIESVGVLEAAGVLLELPHAATETVSSEATAAAARRDRAEVNAGMDVLLVRWVVMVRSLLCQVAGVTG